MGKNSDPESGMEKSRIRDPGSKKSDPGSGKEKVGSGIRDKHPGSATLISGFQYCFYFLTLKVTSLKLKKGWFLPRFIKMADGCARRATC
jgi:hypothetical protein